VRAPPEIRQLSAALANQIAAGEVVERPAAVVKELCENSLDAGATRIAVRCEDGGRRLVEVADDGHGMRAADLALALARHATSKLTTTDDLFRIATLGFRGEALPSIAAVSEFTIASRPHDQDAGHRLAVAEDGSVALTAHGLAPGTVVSVRNLFWNVPARLKFLKSQAAETAHIVEQVTRLALAHPPVAFRLDVDGRALIDLPADEALAARVRALFGRELAGDLLPVAESVGGMQLAGFVAHPRAARPSAKRQYVFLNGRCIRDRLLIAAVREGFKGHLEPRLHGTVFLHLDIDPGQVDVNVHPTKSEVRFRREGEVFTLVSRAIRTVLAANAGGFGLLTPADVARAAAAPTMAPLPGGEVRRTVVRPATTATDAPAWQERYLPAAPATTAAALAPAPIAETPAPAGTDDPARRVATPTTAYVAAPAPPPAAPTAAHLPGVRRVMQLNRMFLLIETDQGIRLVDQHALHEKALFLCLDPAVTDLAASGVQELLIPRAVELGAGEVIALAPLLPALVNRGIHAEVFGPTTILVRGYPAALRRINWQGFFTELAVGGDSAAAVERVQERIAHSAACHAAVKAGQTLSADEQLELVALLYRLDGMEHCPHGRPTTLDLSWAELARRFQR